MRFRAKERKENAGDVAEETSQQLILKIVRHLKRIATIAGQKLISKRAATQFEDQESVSDELVLNVDSERKQKTAPYYMEGWINGFCFKTMIDTSSPVTVFAVDEIKKITSRKDLEVRRMIEGEKYVDFNGKPLNLLPSRMGSKRHFESKL